MWMVSHDILSAGLTERSWSANSKEGYLLALKRDNFLLEVSYKRKESTQIWAHVQVKIPISKWLQSFLRAQVNSSKNSLLPENWPFYQWMTLKVGLRTVILTPGPLIRNLVLKPYRNSFVLAVADHSFSTLFHPQLWVQHFCGWHSYTSFLSAHVKWSTAANNRIPIRTYLAYRKYN